MTILTVPQVCKRLHIHPNTLRRWSDKGIISCFKVNERGDRRYHREEIDNYLEKMNGKGIRVS